MSGEVIDEMLVKISADVSGLKTGMAEANKSLGGLNTAVGKLTGGLKEGLGALAPWAAGLATVAGAVHSVVEAMNRVEEVSRLSDRLGVDTESLVAFRDAAGDTGSSAEVVTTAFRHMSQMTQQLADGSDEVAKSLKQAGVNLEQFVGSSPEKQLGIIADTIQGMGTASERTAFAMKVFGRSGGELVNMLADGSAGLEKFKEDAAKLGMTFSRIQGEEVIKAKLAWGDLGDLFEGLANKAAIELSPALKELADSLMAFMKEALQEGGPLNTTLKDLGTSLVIVIKGMAQFVTLLSAIPKLYAEIKNTGKDLIDDSDLSEASKGMLQFANPIGGITDKLEALKRITRGLKDELNIDTGSNDPFLDKMYGKKMMDRSRANQTDPEADAREKAAAQKKLDEEQALADRTNAMRVAALIKQKETRDKEVEQLMASTLAMRTKLGDKLDIENEAYEKEQKALESAWQKGAVTTEQYEAMKEKSNIEHQQRMYAIANKAMIDQAELTRQAGADFEGLSEKYKTEEELLTEHKNKELEIAYNALAQGAIDAEMFEARKKQIVGKYQQTQRQMLSDKLQKDFSQTATSFGQLSSLMQLHNKKAFEIGKMAAYGEAIFNTAAGIARQFRDLPYPAALATSAAVAVAGAVQIATIAGTQFGGGGSAPGASGGGSVNVGASGSSQTGQSPGNGTGLSGTVTPQQTTIIVNGSMLHGDALDEVMTAINRAQDNGSRLNIRRGSSR